MFSKHIFCIVPVNIAKSYNVLCILHIPDVTVAHTAYTYSGDIKLVTRSNMSIAAAKN